MDLQLELAQVGRWTAADIIAFAKDNRLRIHCVDITGKLIYKYDPKDENKSRNKKMGSTINILVHNRHVTLITKSLQQFYDKLKKYKDDTENTNISDRFYLPRKREVEWNVIQLEQAQAGSTSTRASSSWALLVDDILSRVSKATNSNLDFFYPGTSLNNVFTEFYDRGLEVRINKIVKHQGQDEPSIKGISLTLTDSTNKEKYIRIFTVDHHWSEEDMPKRFSLDPSTFTHSEQLPYFFRAEQEFSMKLLNKAYISEYNKDTLSVLYENGYRAIVQNASILGTSWDKDKGKKYPSVDFTKFYTHLLYSLEDIPILHSFDCFTQPKTNSATLSASLVEIIPTNFYIVKYAKSNSSPTKPRALLKLTRN